MSWPLMVLMRLYSALSITERRQIDGCPVSFTMRAVSSGLSAHLMNSQAASLFFAFFGMPSPWLLAAGKSPFGPAGMRTTRAVSFTLLSGELSIAVTQELEWMKMFERPPISAARAWSSV
ncbi:hypothetical protein D9M68_910050 [compost metagenome]